MYLNSYHIFENELFIANEPVGLSRQISQVTTYFGAKEILNLTLNDGGGRIKLTRKIENSGFCAAVGDPDREGNFLWRIWTEILFLNYMASR